MWKKEWKRSQENLCHLGSQCLLHLTWISWGFCIQFRKWLGLSSLQVPYPEMCPLGRGNPRSCAGDCGYEDLMLEPEQDLHARELHGREGHLKAHPGNPQMCFSRDLACRSYHRKVRLCEEAMTIQREEVTFHSGHPSKELFLCTLLHLPPARWKDQIIGWGWVKVFADRPPIPYAELLGEDEKALEWNIRLIFSKENIELCKISYIKIERIV